MPLGADAFLRFQVESETVPFLYKVLRCGQNNPGKNQVVLAKSVDGAEIGALIAGQKDEPYILFQMLGDGAGGKYLLGVSTDQDGQPHRGVVCVFSQQAVLTVKRSKVEFSDEVRHQTDQVIFRERIRKVWREQEILSNIIFFVHRHIGHISVFIIILCYCQKAPEKYQRTVNFL